MERFERLEQSREKDDSRIRISVNQPITTASVTTAAPKPKLLDQVHQAIRTRHYSPKTEEAYIGWIKRYIFFHNKRHPLEMAEAEIAQFLSNLATESRVAPRRTKP